MEGAAHGYPSGEKLEAAVLFTSSSTMRAALRRCPASCSKRKQSECRKQQRRRQKALSSDIAGSGLHARRTALRTESYAVDEMRTAAAASLYSFR